MTTQRGYELSLPAAQDLEGIYEYTKSKFRENQAIKYLQELEKLFQELSKKPKIGRKRDEIKTGLRGISKSSHVVFYRIIGKRIRIVRILHSSRDIPIFFDR